MEVDWRGLLSEIRVPWIDRGSNTSRGNVNIKCPWCVDDPSYHLSVAEAHEAYFCYREPNQHRGRNFVALLVKLGIPRDEANRLLARFRSRDSSPIRPERLVSDIVTNKQWARFQPASQSKACLSYLEQRSFPSPISLCEQYDLRYAPEGRWASRLLLPLHYDNRVLSWVGRDLSGQRGLKYMFESVPDVYPLYTPDYRKRDAQVLLVVEGPFDALRISYATRHMPVITIGLCGKYLGPAKLLAIRDAGLGCHSTLLAMDKDVPASFCYNMIHSLASLLKSRYIGRAKLPNGCNDPCEIQHNEVQRWVTSAIAELQQSKLAGRNFG